MLKILLKTSTYIPFSGVRPVWVELLVRDREDREEEEVEAADLVLASFPALFTELPAIFPGLLVKGVNIFLCLALLLTVFVNETAVIVFF